VSKRVPSIPKTPPVNVLDAYGRTLDLGAAVSGIIIAAMSEGQPLTLPQSAIDHLREAHQALMAANRAIEDQLTARRVPVIPSGPPADFYAQFKCSGCGDAFDAADYNNYKKGDVEKSVAEGCAIICCVCSRDDG
jgi:hypothetical protein